MNKPANLQTKWNLNTFSWVNEEQLPGWGRLLGSWLEVHRTFNEGAEPIFSWEWGHNERSQIGLLANAATRIGGLSVEESWIRKDSREKQGRSDLWLRLCPPASEKDYLIEAKIEQYLNLDLGEAGQKIAAKMKTAQGDAQRLKGNEKTAVAMVFLSMRFAEDKLDSLEQKTSALISHIWNQTQSQRDCDAIGAIWMGARDFRRSKEERKKCDPNWENVHFGMVLLASRVEV